MSGTQIPCCDPAAVRTNQFAVRRGDPANKKKDANTEEGTKATTDKEAAARKKNADKIWTRVGPPRPPTTNRTEDNKKKDGVGAKKKIVTAASTPVTADMKRTSPSPRSRRRNGGGHHGGGGHQHHHEGGGGRHHQHVAADKHSAGDETTMIGDPTVSTDEVRRDVQTRMQRLDASEKQILSGMVNVDDDGRSMDENPDFFRYTATVPEGNNVTKRHKVPEETSVAEGDSSPKSGGGRGSLLRVVVAQPASFLQDQPPSTRPLGQPARFQEENPAAAPPPPPGGPPKKQIPIFIQKWRLATQVVVKQEFEIGQFVCERLCPGMNNCCCAREHPNRYTAMDERGNLLLNCKESSGACCRYCCGDNRAFTMNCYETLDDSASPRVVLSRAWKPTCCTYPCCCLQVVKVYHPEDTYLGSVLQRCSACWPSYELVDKDGQPAITVKGPCYCCLSHCCCSDIDFPMRDYKSGEYIGSIRKNWGGLLKEGFTEVDTYGATFPQSLPVNQKMLVFAVTILLDYMFFEERSYTKDPTPK